MHLRTYHERVALRMAQSLIGMWHPYGDILDALQRRFPTEEALRVWVFMAEEQLREVDPAVPADFRFLKDDGAH
jgi:hypothetical protein